MATFDDIVTELTAPAAGDKLLVRDVSDASYKDKFMTLSRLAVLSLANTFAALATFSAGLVSDTIKAATSAGVALQDNSGTVGLQVLVGGIVALAQNEMRHSRTKRYAFYNTAVGSGSVLVRVTPGANYMAAHVRIVYVERPGGGVSPLSTECTFSILRMADAGATYGSAINTIMSNRKIALTVDTTNGRWDFKLQTDAGSNVAAGSYNTVMVEVEYSYSSVDWGITVAYAP